jgi:hypothetical protein
MEYNATLCLYTFSQLQDAFQNFVPCHCMLIMVISTADALSPPLLSAGAGLLPLPQLVLSLPGRHPTCRARLRVDE